MVRIVNIDSRMSQIKEKMQKLPSRTPEFPCGKFPPVWKPPVSGREVECFEREKGIKLPEDYRRFITTIASGGTQPFYGLYGLTEKKPGYEFTPIVEKPFPYTIKKPFSIADMSEEEYNRFFQDGEDESYIQGFLLLCTEGCGMDSILVVNTADEETYGTVWFYDLCNDFGIAAILNPQTGKPMHFLDWFEYWLDQTLTLPDDEFFSYGELVYWE